MDRFIWIDGKLVNIGHVIGAMSVPGGATRLDLTDGRDLTLPMSMLNVVRMLRDAGALVYDADDTLSAGPR